VKALVDQEGRTVRDMPAQTIRTLPLSAENWALMREGMEAGYNISTLLRDVRIPGLRVAGKTGTAEFYGPRNERGELPTHGWYTGFAPVDKPEIAVTVFVELGSGSNEAAPIASRIFRKYFNIPDHVPTPAPTPQRLAPQAAPVQRPEPRAPSVPPAAVEGTLPGATPVPAAPVAPAPTAVAPPPAAPAAPTALPIPAAPTLGPRVGAPAPAGNGAAAGPSAAGVP